MIDWHKAFDRIVFQNEAVLEAWKNRNTASQDICDTSFDNTSKAGRGRLLSVTPLPSIPSRHSDDSFLNPFSIDYHGILFHNGDQRHVLLGMCAVSLFNMAITYHSMALTSLVDGKQASILSRQEPNCEKLLRQARGLYLQSNLLLKRVKSRLEPHETLMNVYLAICSNMIVVEAHLGNSNETWRIQLSQSFCLIPARVGCPVYQHFEDILLTHCLGAAGA